MDALNAFLRDIYSEKKIIADGVVPEDFVFASSGFLPQCEDFTPPKGIYSHISGIDLVQAKDGEWYILEDNLRIPSGASYPLIARSLCRQASPATFVENQVDDNRNYPEMLAELMNYVNCGGINVIMTPGRYNAAGKIPETPWKPGIFWRRSLIPMRALSVPGLRLPVPA